MAVVHISRLQRLLLLLGSPTIILLSSNSGHIRVLHGKRISAYTSCKAKLGLSAWSEALGDLLLHLQQVEQGQQHWQPDKQYQHSYDLHQRCLEVEGHAASTYAIRLPLAPGRQGSQQAGQCTPALPTTAGMQGSTMTSRSRRSTESQTIKQQHP